MRGAFYTGEYRNIFKEFGYSEKEIEKRLMKHIKQFFMVQMMRNYIIKWEMIWHIFWTQEIMM